MKLTKETQLFFGCRIDSKLREALALAKPGDRRYFEDPSSEFLRIVEMPRPDRDRNDKYIGKAVKCGMGCGDIEDIQRNVVSILRRIAPEIRTNPTSVKIFVVADETDEVVGADEGPGGGSAGGSGSSSGGGPYIDY